MNKLTDQQKIEKLRNLYDKFHSKMIVLAKRQMILLEKAKRLANEKKLREIRDKIKKS